jgi:hypothetical protein
MRCTLSFDALSGLVVPYTHLAVNLSQGQLQAADAHPPMLGLAFKHDLVRGFLEGQILNGTLGRVSSRVIASFGSLRVGLEGAWETDGKSLQYGHFSTLHTRLVYSNTSTNLFSGEPQSYQIALSLEHFARTITASYYQHTSARVFGSNPYTSCFAWGGEFYHSANPAR